MTPVTLSIELHHNNRTIQGLWGVENHFTIDYGWAVVPGAFPGKDLIQVTLADLDFGRFDIEGDAYLVELLNILPGDLVSWNVEDCI